jgi:hypothetical protein
MSKKYRCVLAVITAIFIFELTNACYVHNHRDGYRYEILENSKIKNSVFEIKLPKNPYYPSQVTPTDTEPQNTNPEDETDQSTTIFKIKLCDYLSKEELSPCSLSHAYKLNIVNMITCGGINKWRLNDNFVLPPFMTDKIRASGL